MEIELYFELPAWMPAPSVAAILSAENLLPYWQIEEFNR
jgi:hypothetical protein